MAVASQLLRGRMAGPSNVDAGPCLAGALLLSTDLRRANLAGACLRDAIVDQNTDFRGANLTGADLRVNERDGGRLAECRFDETTLFDRHTRFPPGFDPVSLTLRSVE